MSQRLEDFGQEWVAAWNAHDLERILSHYAEDIVLISPLAEKRLGVPGGRVEGKSALRVYFARGLAALPDLKFQLLRIVPGLGSLVLEYVAADGRHAAELMVFNDHGAVREVRAHYAG
ncbi:MAG: nuclear transport factor 2 family protein [Proteobacteria bacterium]|nr:nuclear transport factor 2 family protein [Pseudomonadota bacterium]